MLRYLHIVSVSGGKDSLATLLLAIARVGIENVVAIFCDTGNEHESTYLYLDYLEARLGLRIVRLKADFSKQIAAKRLYIARDVRTRREYKRVPKTDAAGNTIYRRTNSGEVELQLVFGRRDGKTTLDLQGVPVMVKRSGQRVRWTNKAKRRALAAMHPTGNPFLDLCIWKGRFPSRRAQFCTEELKRNIAVEFQLAQMEAGYHVISWQGIRRDESDNRKLSRKFERVGPQLQIFRPIVDWTAADVFEYCAACKVEPNPLYLQGMGRVGCMPCINVGKVELRAIAARFPEHPARIAEWEVRVSACCKRGFSTFLGDSHPSHDLREVFADLNVWARIEWAKTSRGGKQFDLLAVAEEASGCSSSYGLCDAAVPA